MTTAGSDSPLQVCTVRYIGGFLPDDPLDDPWAVVGYLGEQLGIEDVSCVSSTIVADALGYHDKTTTRLRSETGGTWSRYAPGEHARSPAGWVPRGTDDS